MYGYHEYKYAPIIFGLIIGSYFLARHSIQIPQVSYAIFITFSVPFVFLMAFMLLFKRILYIQARTKFASLNQLTTVDELELRKLLPESIIKSGADDELLTGYRLNLSSGPVAVIDYSYSIGDGKNSTDYIYSLAAMVFDKQYPHIFLDSRSNGTNGKYQSSQRVNLEGNFNKYFDLYMPEGSGAGSLTLLSPDVMQVLIDQVQPFDIEINGTNVCLITRGYGYTQEKISAFTAASNAITKEFMELNSSWQPVYNLQGKPFKLRKNGVWKTVALVILFYVAYFVVTNIFINR